MKVSHQAGDDDRHVRTSQHDQSAASAGRAERPAGGGPAAGLRLEILTIERQLLDEEVSMVIAPGEDGMVGILPHHQPMLIALEHGELVIRVDGGQDRYVAIGGGVMQVLPDHVVVLADRAEHAAEIDLERAEAAHRRARETLERGPTGIELGHAHDALRHSATRLAVARRHHGHGGR